jgi:hypothetical protein
MNRTIGDALRWFALGVVALFLCTACSIRAAAGPDAHRTPGLGDSLVTIGQWCIYAGAAVTIACTLARVAGFFPATAAIVAIATPFLGEVAALGIATAVLGGVVVWCGVHSWVLYATVVGLALVYAFKHRSRVLAWLNAAKTP